MSNGARAAVLHLDAAALDLPAGADDATVGPWLVVAVGGAQGKIVGFVLRTGPPSGQDFLAALREADPFLDKGSEPNRSGVVVADAAHCQTRGLQQNAADLGSRVERNDAKHPPNRHLPERFFAFLKRDLGPRSGQTLPLPVLEEALKDRIDRYNRGRARRAQRPGDQDAGHRRSSPHPIVPGQAERAGQLPAGIAARRVRRDGVRLNGLRCHSPRLAAHVGEMLNVAYAPNDLSRIDLYRGKTFLCIADLVGAR